CAAARFEPDLRHGRNDRERPDREREAEAFVERSAPHDDQIEAQDHEGAEDKRRLGAKRLEKLQVIRAHGVPPFKAAWKYGDCSAGAIQLSSMSGFSPT